MCGVPVLHLTLYSNFTSLSIVNGQDGFLYVNCIAVPYRCGENTPPYADDRMNTKQSRLGARNLQERDHIKPKKRDKRTEKGANAMREEALFTRWQTRPA